MNLTNTKPIPKTPFWHYLVAFIGIPLVGGILGIVLDYLDSISLYKLIPSLLLFYGILDVAIFQSRRKDKRDALMFDNRVLGFVDGLYLSEAVRFGCSDSEMRRYIEEQLNKTHQLPDNQFLIEYQSANGWHYTSYTGLHGEHELFALLCIAQYAKDYGKDDLVAWCESKMETAQKLTIYY